MLLSVIPFDFVVAALVTLLVVVDPLGLIPAFLAITQGIPKRSRADVALRAAFIAFCILAGAALIGDWLLRMLSISLPAFRIAGGLLLFSIASEMVFGVRSVRQSQTAKRALEERVRSVAAFPLAIPLMAGPGAITATVLLAGRTGGSITQFALLLVVIAVICVICLAAFLSAHVIGKMIGATANIVLSRLLGVLLAALAVQFVVDGVKAAFVS
jgi:multiple antibiotic resistance protein